MPRSRRYQPLADYLAAQPPAVASVRLTLAEIEAIIGVPLPRGSLIKAWWSNTGRSSQGRAWVEVGWQVAQVTTRDRMPVVTFERV